MLDRLRAAPEARGVEGAASLHGDTLSLNALLFRTKLAALPAPAEPGAAALRQRLLDWDGHMAADASAPAAYVAFRRALTAILVERSGLGTLAGHKMLAVAPGVPPANQLWWTLPTLLRADDASLLDGMSWPEALADALHRAAPEAASARPWGEVHRPRLTHPLSPLFPDWAALLDPPSLPIGGDMDTVLATGFFVGGGNAAGYGALARYAFDVGE